MCLNVYSVNTNFFENRLYHPSLISTEVVALLGTWWPIMRRP